MCSSMIGYCHYIEQTSIAIGFPQSDVEQITEARSRIEQRLNEFGKSCTSTIDTTEFTQKKLFETPRTPVKKMKDQNDEYGNDQMVPDKNAEIGGIALQRQLKLYPRLQRKFEEVYAADETLKSRPELRSCYTEDWVDLVNFRVCDAAKPEESYDDEGSPITHIYSYNKVMSAEDRAGIAKILNKTNYRIMAWYFNPVETERSGLRDFLCLGRMPMHSTGGERFTVYVYFRTFRYVKGIEKAWDKYDEEEDEAENS